MRTLSEMAAIPHWCWEPVVPVFSGLGSHDDNSLCPALPWKNSFPQGGAKVRPPYLKAEGQLLGMFLCVR